MLLKCENLSSDLQSLCTKTVWGHDLSGGQMEGGDREMLGSFQTASLVWMTVFQDNTGFCLKQKMEGSW